ncbi:PREDICTED: endochitinase CHI-like [Tarenaya hassleriana]|uniref:endochitinase CHI-like n=1 Tax=Tarenaya hassleriana TaxID=28532 RepID=UPI00053C17B5|nr:PREDICTED: endochitinase CHI-like [Tarenaya hassleriana]
MAVSKSPSKDAFTLTLLLLAMSKAVFSQSLEGTVTQQFFDSIRTQRVDCPGRSFYTRGNFLQAARSYGGFGSSISKTEIAAFFAHVKHETGWLCYTEENDRSNSYCNGDDPEFPCAPGKSYYGRGPIQLTGNYNYGLCGRALKLNLLNRPELVAQDPIVSFKTAFWFWTTNVRPVLNQGFGATIRAINGIECDGGRPDTVAARVQYYRELCRKLGVNPGNNLSC